MNIFNVNIEMIANFFFAGLCGLLLKICLSYSDQKWVNTFHYTLTFILLPVITLTITRIISNNIALALGMVGALSIVRFRNPVKNPFELVLYFLLITIGIGMAIRSIYGFGLTFFSIFVIVCTFLFKKKYNSLFSLSFSEGRPQHQVEITSYTKIKEIEENKFLIQKIVNKLENDNYEYFYRLSSVNKDDIENIKNENFLKDNKNITNLTINYFY